MKYHPWPLFLTGLCLGLGQMPLQAQPEPLVGRPPPEWQAPPKGERVAMVPGADPYSLLVHNQQVQEDLAMRPEQIQQLIRADRDFRVEVDAPPMTPPGRGAGPTSPTANPQERHLRKTKGIIAQVLTPPQLRRLQEISFQINGPCLLSLDPELARSLQLTADQSRRMLELCGQFGERLRGAVDDRPGASAAERCAHIKDNRQRMRELQTALGADILALFSPAQRDRYARLAGAPFSLDARIGPACPGEAGNDVPPPEWRAPPPRPAGMDSPQSH